MPDGYSISSAGFSTGFSSASASATGVVSISFLLRIDGVLLSEAAFGLAAAEPSPFSELIIDGTLLGTAVEVGVCSI